MNGTNALFKTSSEQGADFDCGIVHYMITLQMSEIRSLTSGELNMDINLSKAFQSIFSSNKTIQGNNKGLLELRDDIIHGCNEEENPDTTPRCTDADSDALARSTDILDTKKAYNLRTRDRAKIQTGRVSQNNVRFSDNVNIYHFCDNEQYSYCTEQAIRENTNNYFSCIIPCDMPLDMSVKETCLYFSKINTSD